MDKQQFKVVPTTTIKVPLGVRYVGGYSSVEDTLHFSDYCAGLGSVIVWMCFQPQACAIAKHVTQRTSHECRHVVSSNHPSELLRTLSHRTDTSHQALFCRQIPDTTIFPQQTWRLVSSLNCLSLSLPKFGPTPTGVRVQILRGLETC